MSPKSVLVIAEVWVGDAFSRTGIDFRYRTGVAWCDLPERFGPWQTELKRQREEGKGEYPLLGTFRI